MIHNLDLDLPELVEDKNGEIYFVDAVKLSNRDTADFILVDKDAFLQTYTEYVNPMQLEINRLTEENKKLKEQLKPLRKPRRKLSKGEILEIEELISKGETNRPIAKEYDISETAISKIRVRMRKGGEDV